MAAASGNRGTGHSLGRGCARTGRPGHKTQQSTACRRAAPPCSGGDESRPRHHASHFVLTAFWWEGGGHTMQNADRPVTIITGGTRGIGAATAACLARAGHDLVLAYRQDESAAQQTAARV